MKLADNPSRRVMFLVAIVISVLQAATLVDADVAKRCGENGSWCCEKDVVPQCVGEPKDRLNYSIECLSPNVINVSWEITQRTVMDDYIVHAQYTCYNSTSQDETTWILSNHVAKLSDNIVVDDLTMGDDVSCTFTACTNGAQIDRLRCFDYIDKEDEVTIDSTCFATGDSHALSGEESSVVPTSANLLQQSESSLLVTAKDPEGGMSPMSIESALSSPMLTQTDDKNPNLGDAVVVLLCVGFIFVGLVSLATFVAACYSRKKKTKVNDTLFDGSMIYKPKPPTENILADDLRYVGVSGSLLTLLEPLQFFNVDHREKALMIHMESSGEGFTHVSEENDDPDSKCAHDNVSLTTVRLDDVQSLKNLCSCPHPSSECLSSECSSIDTPVHSQHQVNEQGMKTRPVQENVSSKTPRNTRHLSSATSGYISTGYTSDSDASRLPSFRSGFTLSVSTDGYVGDMNLEPGLQEDPDATFREDSLEPPFISRHDDYVFDSSIDMTCGPPADHFPGIPPIAGCYNVEDNSKQVHSLPSGASEYIRDSHSHQIYCSSSISTSADDQDCCFVPPTPSDGGYICGFLSDVHLADDRVREFDPAHCQPSPTSLPLLAQDKNGTDSSCNSNCIGNAAGELVAAQGQHSASLTATAVDGYIQDSSCVPPPPTGAVHGHSQPSIVPSSLASNSYVGDSPLVHQLHHHSPLTSMSPGDQNCAPVSLPVSDGYICEFPRDSPLPDNGLQGFAPAHKQPSAPSATVSCAANCSNFSYSPSLPGTTTHHPVSAHNQSPAFPFVPAVDGYIHDSSCAPLPPAGTPHGYGQPTTPSSSLPSQPSTPAGDGYVHDSSCVPRPCADEAHRHSKSSALPSHLTSNGYICDSSRGVPTSSDTTCGIDSVPTQLPTPQSPFKSDGYVYDPSHTSPASVNGTSGLYTGHRQPCAVLPTCTSASDGYIHNQSHVRPTTLLPSRESKGHIMASDSCQPVATPPTTTSDGYTCDSYNSPPYSTALDSKSKGEVSMSAPHPCLHFLSDAKPTTSLVNTNRLQPRAASSQLPPAAIDGVTRNMRLQISIDFPTQALPLSSDYVTESSLPPRAGYDFTRKYNTPPLLQTRAHDGLDEDSLCNVHSVCRNKPNYTQEEIRKVCMDPTMDPAHGDGYIITPLHS